MVAKREQQTAEGMAVQWVEKTELSVVDLLAAQMVSLKADASAGHSGDAKAALLAVGLVVWMDGW